MLWGVRESRHMEGAGLNGFHPLGAGQRLLWPRVESVKAYGGVTGTTPFRRSCLFCVCPDRVGDAAETLDLFAKWHRFFDGWPVAFVAQDGQEDLDFPDEQLWECLFVGGSTRWKMSLAAEECILRGQAMGKHIHIGRVNKWRRYQHFRAMGGSDEWTCDGTTQRFMGIQAAQDLWSSYMARDYQLRLAFLGGDSGGESGSSEVRTVIVDSDGVPTDRLGPDHKGRTPRPVDQAPGSQAVRSGSVGKSIDGTSE